MKYILVLLLSLLSSCSTTSPVVPAFPPAPPELLKKCEQLKQVEPDKNSITDLLTTVVENYSLYYECSNRVGGWQEWYKVQKDIFESMKK